MPDFEQLLAFQLQKIAEPAAALVAVAVVAADAMH